MLWSIPGLVWALDSLHSGGSLRHRGLVLAGSTWHHRNKQQVTTVPYKIVNDTRTNQNMGDCLHWMNRRVFKRHKHRNAWNGTEYDNTLEKSSRQVTHTCVSVKHRHCFRQPFVSFSTPSRYLIQCRLVINWTLRNKYPWYLNQTTIFSIVEMSLMMLFAK